MPIRRGYVISDIEKYFRFRYNFISRKLTNDVLSLTEREYYLGIYIELQEILDRFFIQQTGIIFHDFRDDRRVKTKVY
jgi:hypothetical protein